MTILNKMFATLQRVGQSLMIPVSVLPAAGLLVALGRVLKDNFPVAGTSLHTIGEVLYLGGLAIFEQLPVVFAMGVAIGFSQGAGVAALAAGVGYFTLVNVLKVMSALNPTATALNTGVFGGILVGALAAFLYNRYQKVQLHPIFGFFSGRRLIPILTAASCIILGLILGFCWSPIQEGIKDFGLSVMNSPWGPAMYAAGKRMLIPLGLHHVYYPPFLFEFGEFTNAAGQILKGDSARYFAGDPAAGKMMASEFPIMLFGLPMAAFAIYLRARPENRKAVGGMMLSAALTSIITGITEPIEFAFIFVAPLLYVVHVALAFASGYLTSFFDIHLGYTFSASLIDFGVGFFNQKNSFYLWLIVGPLIAVTYFACFYGLIGLFNFKTPGREPQISGDDLGSDSTTGSQKAASVLQALGGSQNIQMLDACITRLRLTVHDASLVQKEKFKSLGASGVMQSGLNLQIIFGVESDHLKEEIKNLMSKTQLFSPLDGQLLKLEEVPDATFAEKILGDGFAIDPTSNLVKAPCAGKVTHVFPTGHALALLTPQGLEILVHVGIDTVKMKGEGFEALVKTGDQVVAGDDLIRFDLELVRKKAKSTITPIIITNMDRVKTFQFLVSGGQARIRSAILSIEVKS